MKSNWKIVYGCRKFVRHTLLPTLESQRQVKLLWVQGHPRLQREFQDNQAVRATEKSYLLKPVLVFTCSICWLKKTLKSLLEWAGACNSDPEEAEAERKSAVVVHKWRGQPALQWWHCFKNQAKAGSMVAWTCSPSAGEDQAELKPWLANKFQPNPGCMRTCLRTRKTPKLITVSRNNVPKYNSSLSYDFTWNTFPIYPLH